MEMTSIQMIGAGIFALALLHTFTAKYFEILAHRHPPRGTPDCST